MAKSFFEEFEMAEQTKEEGFLEGYDKKKGKRAKKLNGIQNKAIHHQLERV